MKRGLGHYILMCTVLGFILSQCLLIYKNTLSINQQLSDISQDTNILLQQSEIIPKKIISSCNIDTMTEKEYMDCNYEFIKENY